jgi:hypothetical protein
MFTTGSKLFLGSTVLSIVAAVAISVELRRQRRLDGGHRPHRRR